MPRLSPERWRRVEPILDRALDLPLSARAAFLDDACGGDAELRADAEALLTAEREASGFLEVPAASLLLTGEAMPAGASTNVGMEIGQYRIVRELGRGGMGTVYLAERADGQFDQRVALKLIRGVGASEDLVQRFLHERQILARLEHPNIARLLDGGLTHDGEPYFAMEYIDGVPITDFCAERALTIEQRLRLFRAAAEAVACAHRNLVVHRDLKPSNVMVTVDGRVKLLDFGIAKVLEEPEDSLALTRSGLYLLTPEYAAPEQVRGAPITTATDVYMLGALLYELLSGSRAHQFDQRTPAELARVICDENPVPPSTAVVTRAKHADGPARVSGSRRDPETRRLRRRLHGDLDNIVMKALRKEPERRYVSVDALIDDIDRYEKGLPVTARRDSFGYRSAKFVRRNRVGVAAAAVVLISLFGGMISTSRQARVAARESAKAEQVKNFVLDLFEQSDPDLSNGAEVTARQLLERGDDRVNEELAGQPELQAEMLAVLGSIDQKLGLYDEAASHFERALEIERQLHGTRHQNVAARLHDLGSVEIDRSRLAEAERLHREALELRRSLFGNQHAEVARSLAALAAALNANGKYDDAEALQREALAIDRVKLGAEHAEVANDLENLASILHDKGDYEAAVAAAEEMLTLRRKILGPEHLETATAMNNLAVYLHRRGDLQAADTLYRQVLAFDMRRLGPDHPNTATVTNNLANVLYERGQLDEAERLYRRVLAFDRAHFGERHRYTALVSTNLAAVLKDQHEYAESEQLYREALDIYRQVLGDEHPSIAFAETGLAAVLHERGERDDAEALYRKGLDQLDRTVGAHPRTAAVRLGYGRLLIERGQAKDAEPLLADAITILLASYADDDYRVAETRAALGEALAAQGRFAEAERLLIASYGVLEQRQDRPDELRQAARAIVSLYQAWNRPERAAPFLASATR